MPPRATWSAKRWVMLIFSSALRQTPAYPASAETRIEGKFIAWCASLLHNFRRYSLSLTNNHRWMTRLSWHGRLVTYRQWWKQDQNVKTKTKTKTIRSRPRSRPRPIKQQLDYITNKTLLLQHAFYLSKNNCVQKTSKRDMMTSYMYVWHCFCTYCTKKYRCLLHFSITMSHSISSGTTVLEARPEV